MNRPYVIIHTHTSVDGNIDIMDLPGFYAGSQHYQDLALTPGKKVLGIDAYLNGKTSTEDNITHYRTPELNADAVQVPEGDYFAVSNAAMYYISIDPRGELAFDTNTFGYGGVPTHFIEVLTDAASNAYKDFLRRKQISYIIAGEQQVDYALMLHKLHGLGIKRLMVGGGGVINWSFLQNGLVDEVSSIIAPVANGDPNAHRFFTAREPYSTVQPVEFELTNVEVLGDSVVWLRYTPKPVSEVASS
ncbi:dihydrofolate reductase family protein [Corynebacterium crudilactis]|uniref:5-amino-6-(5-phosphoribosylamino)uracil reductase n=1 Tax=Corynebacterium crudilactis TaxID=1652495 RepID=A0A172QUI8_9CORY|nr:RibD family protein [Corynebacterium crudilactis]ANE04336.1 5-amino-6-(5-phosphoribosylamino)uracil reductase [Corynebacterium crudilactis]